jgi:hypothetical protein
MAACPSQIDRAQTRLVILRRAFFARRRTYAFVVSADDADDYMDPSDAKIAPSG